MLPLEMKIKNNGKVILKDILKKYIPSHLIERPKQDLKSLIFLA